jgi:cytidyltransferase-like protein
MIFCNDRNSQVIGFTSGVFDLLHRGHLNYLSACKRHCDVLIVGVDGDALVKERKGPGRPFDSIKTRLENVGHIDAVDKVLIKCGSTDLLLEDMHAYVYFAPDNRKIQQSRRELLRRLSVRLVVLPYTHGISTSVVAQQMPLNSGVMCLWRFDEQTEIGYK